MSAKMFERIMNKRLTIISECANWLSWFQMDLEKDVQLPTALYYCNKQYTQHQKKETRLAVFLDINKAYDCVNSINFIKFKKSARNWY